MTTLPTPDELRGPASGYVPGVYRCPKCEFRLVQSVINTADGTIGARDEPGGSCPNCDGPLWRVTYRDENRELMDALDKLADEKADLEKRLTWALESRLPEPASEDLRERVARVIDPEAFRTREFGKWFEARWDAALAKADAILSIVLPQEGGWRPISEAPRDGTRILVFDPDAKLDWNGRDPVVMVAWLNDAERSQKERMEWCVPGSWQDEQGGYYTVDQPTHWLPLPPPPAPQPVGGEGLRK